jgi:hypothetical protein
LSKSEVLIPFGLKPSDLVVRALILGTGDWGLGTIGALHPFGALRGLLDRL